MAKFIQRNFSAGEISPELYSRNDFVSYQNGARTARNFYVRRQGGLDRRPGTEFHGFAKFSDKVTRMIPFQFSQDDTFILEFGDRYIRFYKNGDLIVIDPSGLITAIQNAVNPEIDQVNHGLSVNDTVFITAQFANGEFVNREFSVSEVINVNRFKVHDLFGNDIDTSALGAFSTGNFTAAYEVGTQIDDFELRDVRFSQSADFLTIVHKNKGIYNLIRTADDNWTLEQEFLAPSIEDPDVPSFSTPSSGTGVQFSYRYYLTAIDANTGDESWASFADIENIDELADDKQLLVTLDWDQANVGTIDSFNIYRETYTSTATPEAHDYAGVGFISNIKVQLQQSGKERAFFVDKNFITPDTSKKPPLPDGIYGSVIGRNFYGGGPFDLSNLHPNAITTSKQRRFYGGFNATPEEVDGSAISRYTDFSDRFPGTAIASDPVSFQTVSEKVGVVQHLVDFKRLLVFTDTSEWVAQGGENGAISATGLPNPEKLSENGSGNLRPIIADMSVLYVQARGNLVRSIGGSIAYDDYQGDELSIFSSHFVDGYEIVDWSYQKAPHGIVWMVRNDGKVLSLTYNKEQQIKGWAQHDFQNGEAKSVATIAQGDQDQTYFIVNRTVNGVLKSFIESFNTREIIDAREDALLDSYIEFDGRNTNTSLTMTASAADYAYPMT